MYLYLRKVKSSTMSEQLMFKKGKYIHKNVPTFEFHYHVSNGI